MRKLLPSLALLAALLVPSLAFAQATSVQQSGSRLDATTVTGTATGAGNTSVVATLNGVNGQFIYVTMVEIEVGANAAVTGAAVVQACVTAGLTNNLTFEGNNTTLVIGDVKTQPYYFATPIKLAAPGSNFTVTCSGMQSTQTLRVNLAGYIAP